MFLTETANATDVGELWIKNAVCWSEMWDWSQVTVGSVTFLCQIL